MRAGSNSWTKIYKSGREKKENENTEFKLSKHESFKKYAEKKNKVLIRNNLYKMQKEKSHNKNKGKNSEQWEVKFSHNTLC